MKYANYNYWVFLQIPIKKVSFWWFVFTKTLLVSLSKQFSVKKLTLNTVFGLLKWKYSAQTPFRTEIVNI